MGCYRQEVRWEKPPCSPPNQEMDLEKEDAGDALAASLLGQALACAASSQILVAPLSGFDLPCGGDSSCSSLHYETHHFVCGSI